MHKCLTLLVLEKSWILFTGGTIAGGSRYSPLDNTQYGQLQITAEEIFVRNTYLYNFSQIAVSNWTAINDGSTGTNETLVMNMAYFTHDALCSEDSDIQVLCLRMGHILLKRRLS